MHDQQRAHGAAGRARGQRRRPAGGPHRTARDRSVEPEPDRWKHIVIEAPNPDFSIYGWKQASGGYAAVWAHENTRASIWDGMKRKETYATTGSRMTVRFFGGWDFSNSDLEGDYVAQGYAKGVPMGGDLSNGHDKKPTFLVYALMDPDGGSLLCSEHKLTQKASPIRDGLRPLRIGYPLPNTVGRLQKRR